MKPTRSQINFLSLLLSKDSTNLVDHVSSTSYLLVLNLTLKDLLFLRQFRSGRRGRGLDPGGSDLLRESQLVYLLLNTSRDLPLRNRPRVESPKRMSEVGLEYISIRGDVVGTVRS